jgi:SPP1 gp7 family putative phage head morphogenesis protein
MQMKKKQQKKYELKRNTIMDMNYEKTLKDVFKQLDREYKRVLREIEDELLKWESKRASGAMPNTFGYSEEQHLRESKKAIELLINELAEKEYKLLDRAMSKLYAQDLLDMNKLEIEYLKYRDDLEIEYMADYMRRNPMSKASMGTDAFSKMTWGSGSLSSTGATMSAIATRTDSIMWIEQVLRQPVDTELLSMKIWYVGYDNKGFNKRIAERAIQLREEITQALTSMYSQGQSYTYARDRIKERLQVSEHYAQRLVATEARVAEVQANTKHYKDMGVKYYQRMTVKDKNVCEKCKKAEGRVYTSEELESNPWISILHPQDRCILQPLSSVKGEEEYRKWKARKN